MNKLMRWAWVMLLIVAWLPSMADAGALIDYTLNGTPAATDQLLMLDDPLGTWATNRVSISVLWDLLRAAPGEIGAGTPAAGTFTTLTATSITASASATPGFWGLDSGAPGTDKDVGNLQWNYIDGADGSENADFWIAITQGGVEDTQILLFDESDDQWETSKMINSSGGFTGTLTGSASLNALAASPTFTGIVTFPIAADPTTDADGEMSFDTDGWGSGYDALEIWNGTASAYVVATTASDTPTNGQVPKWNTGGTITWEDDGGGAGTPTAITVADTTDTTSYVALFESATGDLGPKTDLGITYNAGTGMLTATGFTGNVVGAASTTPGITMEDSSAAQGTAFLYGNSSGGAYNVVMSIGVEDSTGESQEYIQLDGVNKTVDVMKPLTVAGNTTIGAAVADTDYTITFDGESSNGIVEWDEDQVAFFLDTENNTDHEGLKIDLDVTANNTIEIATHSGTGTTALSFSSLNLSTTGTFDLGHATANTLSASDGVLSIEGAVLATAAGSQTGTHSSASTTNPLAPTWTTSMHTVWYNVAGEIDLPAATGYAGRGILIYNTAAYTITIDPNGSEVIVRDGTVQTGGYKITLSSGAGNYVGMFCDGARWVTLGYKGTLADGGA